MDLTLTRKQYRNDGIFGELADANGLFDCVTLEHAYPGQTAPFYAKIPFGAFECVRGKHSLFKVPNQFETFEVTGVDGHTGLLFHPGNYDNDSEGCILVGEKIMQLGFGAQMLTNSKITFMEFMRAQHDVDTFTLSVV